MTEPDFKTEVRLARGKLTNHDVDMETIYRHGTAQLRDFTLTKKLMGIKNIAWIATQPPVYQNEFTEWMDEKDWKADKNELDLWFAANPGV